MVYFTQDYLDFFHELYNNNNKEWFDQNRKRYENSIRKPMIALVGDVILSMCEIDPEFKQDPRKCLGRINRDIRFSKDKTPYNSHFFAHITKGGKENPIPGIAYRFGAFDSGIMTGYYKPTKERLERIRQRISSDVSGFQKIKSNKNLVSKFGCIQGEAYKRIPKELQSTYDKEPLIVNKQFYFVVEKKSRFNPFG